MLYEKIKDEKTGLLYQAWNCEGKSYWAEHEDAHSSQFWSRSIGWFLTAALDILYYLPKTHHLRGAREGFLPPQYLKTGQAGYEGLIIAFKNFNPNLGILDSSWVGLKHFRTFFEGYYFKRTLLNTLKISFSNLIFGFPAPIILALLINELRNAKFAKAVQTISYLPHFLSIVVVCGMIKNFSLDNGLFNDVAAFLGFQRSNILLNKNAFLPLYVLTDIWQNIGWGSIVYLAAFSGVDAQLYEAATIDGANRWQQMKNITIPSIVPTIWRCRFV